MDAQLQQLYDRSKQYDDEVRKLCLKGRDAFRVIRTTSTITRNNVLHRLADLLDMPENIQAIVAANEIDLKNGEAANLTSSLMDRLKLDEGRIHKLAQSVRDIAALPDPVGEIVSGKRLPNGIELLKKRVPLGVIFTVYESRPNVTVDVGALSMKSGNAALLRGGKEAIETNRALYRIFRMSLEMEGLPGDVVQLVQETDRAYMLSLLQRDDLLDLVVPRGGEALIKFVNSNSRIPVVKHDKGVCNMYIDESAEEEIAVRVTINSKLQRPSVCNSIENLLIHESFPHTVSFLNRLKEAGAELLGCEKTREIFPAAAPIADPDEEYSTEYLDNRLAVKIVSGFDETVEFIYKYGSGHSEGIVATNHSTIEKFTMTLDSAALFVNCSTYFHDGGQMGMGAEVGISTQRLHVRGPMGLSDLTTTTHVAMGNGQIRQ